MLKQAPSDISVTYQGQAKGPGLVLRNVSNQRVAWCSGHAGEWHRTAISRARRWPNPRSPRRRQRLQQTAAANTGSHAHQLGTDKADIRQNWHFAESQAAVSTETPANTRVLRSAGARSNRSNAESSLASLPALGIRHASGPSHQLSPPLSDAPQRPRRGGVAPGRPCPPMPSHPSQPAATGRGGVFCGARGCHPAGPGKIDIAARPGPLPRNEAYLPRRRTRSIRIFFPPKNPAGNAA